MEEYKDIVGFENYEVSNKGRVRNKNTNCHLWNSENEEGYEFVRLSNKCKQTHKRIHRLVAEAFIPNPLNKRFVTHIDGDRSNNKVENLMWVTQPEYMKDIERETKTGIKGCCFHKRTGKWQAFMRIDGKQKHIGYFNTIDEAKNALEAKKNIQS